MKKARSRTFSSNSDSEKLIRRLLKLFPDYNFSMLVRVGLRKLEETTK